MTLHGRHTRLQAVSIGTGRRAVVFLHEVGSQGMCGFWGYAWWLSHHRHVRSVLVDRCGYGTSHCRGLTRMSPDEQVEAQTAPAVRWASAHGADDIVLVGASAGGGDALQAAAALPRVDAVADLSGDETDTGAKILQVAGRVQVPAFVAVSHSDPYCSIRFARKQFNAINARDKRFYLDPGQGLHGWDLLMDMDGPRKAGRVLADWIVRH